MRAVLVLVLKLHHVISILMCSWQLPTLHSSSITVLYGGGGGGCGDDDDDVDVDAAIPQVHSSLPSSAPSSSAIPNSLCITIRRSEINYWIVN